MDEPTVHPETLAGDPFAHAGEAGAKAKAKASRRLAVLRDRYRHELTGDEERQELRDEIVGLER